MRKSQSFSSALLALVLAIVPHFAEAGPCSGDIADLETAIRLFGGNPLRRQERQSVNAQPSHQPVPDLGKRLQSQFSATMARAKRLDMQGERLGCIGVLNAARDMYALVDKQ
jgi:hypothetical protein